MKTTINIVTEKEQLPKRNTLLPKDLQIAYFLSSGDNKPNPAKKVTL
jgi:hypothetical protein